ncbi:MAG: carboxypeptidase regulatory-like domain-containing protein, partial [Myxococcota bacterium]
MTRRIGISIVLVAVLATSAAAQPASGPDESGTPDPGQPDSAPADKPGVTPGEEADAAPDSAVPEPAAPADAVPDSAPPDPAGPSDSPGPVSEPGQLRVLVFVGRVPVFGVELTIEGQPSVSTNQDGTAEFSLSGGTYTIRASVPRQLLPGVSGIGPVTVETKPVDIVPGEEVEAILTLDRTGKISNFDVETADVRAEERRREAEFERRRRSLPQGKVRGKLYTGAVREPVSGARVFVRGVPVEAVTDDEGVFELELPEGRYDLTIIHPRYITVNLRDVDVDANRPKELRVAAEPATAQLEDFVVTAPHIEGGVAGLVTERRESASVDEVIGVEEMSRSGDSDAAGALKRVTGITVVGGQFVYVRGMGERYSSTLLNGQYIPSPEPERRVVPLDLFSTDVLESVVIQKTPSPDSPGEFGGGVVQLRTRGFPDEFTLSASASLGAVTTATFRSRPGYRGGSFDVLGFDDGTRELSDTIRDNSPLVRGS